MSKKFKNFIFIFIGVVAFIGICVGGYFLISNLSTTTIYDFRIVNAETGKAMNDTEVYLVSGKQNYFEIYVNIDASSENAGYTITSSNPSVASLKSNNNGGYIVEYHQTGTAVITAQSTNTSDVYDSFTLSVNQTLVADFEIEDAEDNIITLYADGNAQSYNYIATGVLADIECNKMLLKAVENYDTSVIKDIYVNSDDNKIVISTNLVDTNSQQTFYIQAYYLDDDGQEWVVKNYSFIANVVGYHISETQLVVSQDNNFSEDEYIFLSSQNSAYQQNNGETVVPEIYLTDNINVIYFKLRAVYTNNTFVDLPVNFVTILNNSGVQLLKDSGVYFMAIVDKTTSNVSFTTSVYDQYAIQNIINTFNFTYLAPSSDAYNYFYSNKLYSSELYSSSDKEYTIYKFIYWDTRFKRLDAITDEEGNIVGFEN